MPELPEVETIRKTLEKLVLDKQIEDITVHWPKIIKSPDDIQHFKQLLLGEKLLRIDRRGKFLLFYFNDHVLVSHLRMEGKYRLTPSTEPVDKHTHVIFHFTDGTDLRYNDVRKFGTMHVFPVGTEHHSKPLNKLGPDPFQPAFSNEYVNTKLRKTTRPIKAALLDQSIIAGLGNIYVDEVLFLSNVHPEKRANTLTDTEIKCITDQSFHVLERAVQQGGTTIRSYVDGAGEMGMFQQQLYVYGQQKEPCQKCGTKIEKIKVAGRGTHICPVCQRR